MGVDEGCFADEGLVAHAPKGAEDRGLAWFLALGVLRNRSHVDASLRAHLRQPIGSLDSGVRATLRVGAFEKLYARTPPHAVVNEAVEVCKVIGKGHARGLVNAVLRKVAEPQGLSVEGTVRRGGRLEVGKAEPRNAPLGAGGRGPFLRSLVPRRERQAGGTCPFERRSHPRCVSGQGTQRAG
jgi:hypothetical protein